MAVTFEEVCPRVKLAHEKEELPRQSLVEQRMQITMIATAWK